MAALLVLGDEGEIILREVFVNPKTTSESVRKVCLVEGEGCLSVDKDIEGYILCPNKLKIHYYTVGGKEKTIHLKDHPMVVASHGTDHLNDHLFYGRISKQNPFDLAEGTIVIS